MILPQLLIATCKMDQGPFKEGVVLLFKHDEKGGQGLMINRPLETNLGTILKQLNIKSHLSDVVDRTIFLGGPLDRGQGLILCLDSFSGENLAVEGQRACLEDIAKGRGPKDFLIALGHAAWIKDGYWIQRSVDTSLLFKTPVKDRWKTASQQLGFDMRTMTHFAGHG